MTTKGIHEEKIQSFASNELNKEQYYHEKMIEDGTLGKFYAEQTLLIDCKNDYFNVVKGVENVSQIPKVPYLAK